MSLVCLLRVQNRLDNPSPCETCSEVPEVALATLG